MRVHAECFTAGYSFVQLKDNASAVVYCAPATAKNKEQETSKDAKTDDGRGLNQIKNGEEGDTAVEAEPTTWHGLVEKAGRTAGFFVLPG